MNIRKTTARRLTLLVCVFVLMLTSCAAADSTEETPGTFNASMFSGSFNVVDVTVADVKVQLFGQPTVAVDETAASISADTGCNTHLGSYSFFEDGTASVTLTGGTRTDCEVSTQQQDDSITVVLEQVESWTSSSETSITLSTTDGNMIELQRQ